MLERQLVARPWALVLSHLIIVALARVFRWIGAADAARRRTLLSYGFPDVLSCADRLEW